MKILTFSTLFPNGISPNHGIFVQQRLKQLLAYAPDIEVKVMAPVPWFPSRHPRFGQYTKFVDVPEKESLTGIDIFHPRYPVIPKVGMSIAPVLLYFAVKSRVLDLIKNGFDFDLIDAHYFYPDGVAAAMLAKKFNKPLVITARGTDINLIADYAIPRKQIVKAAHYAKKSVTVSRALKDRLHALGIDNDKIVVLRNGVDCDVFKPASDRDVLRKKLGFTEKVLLSVGNLVELKGHHLVIEALKELPDEVNLVLAGDGDMRFQLESQVAALKLTDRVRFAGRLEQEQLVDYYAAADYLVLASSREGLPNVVLESMACGTPVIATTVGGVPEVVNNTTGCLVTERSVQDIANGVLRCLEKSPPRDEVRQHARQFSWETTSKGQINLFQSMIATN